MGATAGFRTIIYPVTDLARSKALFGALLGVAPSMDEAYYVGFDAEGQHVDSIPMVVSRDDRARHLLGCRRHPRDPAGAARRRCGDDARSQGRGGGKLIASVKDADGNVVGLIQPS